MLHIMKNEKMVNVQLVAELFGFTTMTKQEVEGMLINNVKCEMVFTKPNGEQVKLEVFGDLQTENIQLLDEDGIEIHEEITTY
jgi:hypothetical protein